jgi:hypothetical protein
MVANVPHDANWRNLISGLVVMDAATARSPVNEAKKASPSM